MTHLLAQLLRLHDLWSLSEVMLLAIIGGSAAMLVLLRPAAMRASAIARLCAFVGLVTTTSWVTFICALHGAFPQLTSGVPLHWMIAALATVALASLAAIACHLFFGRSARNAMLSGSLLAFGQSCMVFIAMTGLVHPFTLAYDLSGVMVVMLVSAAAWGLALREAGNPAHRGRLPITASIVALAGALLPIGSLGSILPLEDWMTALDRTDDLSSAPIAILVASEAAAVLILCLFGSLMDNRAHARDRLEASRQRQLADSTFEGILVCRNQGIVDANEALAAMLGLSLDEVCLSPLERFLSRDDLALTMASTGQKPRETEIINAKGEQLPVEILSRAITYGGAPATVVALRDIRERKESEARIRFLAHHDMLTGLPNRVTLKEGLDDALRRAGRLQSPLAVLCLDLDGFKLVNDTLGHAAGDMLLCQVAARIKAVVDARDLVARVGGDEFVVLQTGGTQPDDAVALAKRVITCLSARFDLDGQTVTVGTSIGVATYPEDGDEPMVLLKKADMALYKVKKEGRGWFSVFEPGMVHTIGDRRTLEQDLRAAVEKSELDVAFQPLLGSDGAILSFEALLRWTHPTRGPVSPSEFIPIAEESGIIFPLSRWVLHSACKAALSWDHPCRVAVNLSPAQFLRGDLLATVMEVLAETGLPPNRLELEITEGVLMDNSDRTLETLVALRAEGLHLVLDDFGTGYSSLSYLHRFPLDKLKIDRSFTQRLGTDSDSRAIVNAIIAMSRSLSLDVTAEGVETLQQFEILRAQGCHEFQGYLLGRPLPGKDVRPFIDERMLHHNDRLANAARAAAQ